MPPEQGGQERLPPQSREAERSVLGSMLRDNGVIGDVVQIIRADELLESAERKVLEIAQLGITGQTYTLGQALAEAYDRIDARNQRDQMSISGISTGYIDLNEITAGLQNSELVIIAARPSVGKT